MRSRACPPTIAIEQKALGQNPRSIVATTTEIYDYLRVLFARVGTPHCPNGHAIERQDRQQIVDQVLALPEGTRLLVLAPLIEDRKTEGDRIFEAAAEGFVRVRVDGEMVDIPTRPQARQSTNATRSRSSSTVGIVRHADAPDGADSAPDGRPIETPEERACHRRIPDAGRLSWLTRSRRCCALRRRRRPDRPLAPRDGEAPSFEEQRYSEKFSCSIDGHTADELEPRQLLLQLTPRGVPGVHRAGMKSRSTRTSSSRDRSKSLARGALVPWARMPTDASWRLKILEAICAAHGWDFESLIRDLPAEAVDYVLHARKETRRSTPVTGTERGENTYKATFEGVVTNLERRYRETDSMHRGRAREVHGHGVARPARDGGSRPRDPAGTIGERNVRDVSTMSIMDALAWSPTGLEAYARRARADDRRSALLKEIGAWLYSWMSGGTT